MWFLLKRDQKNSLLQLFAPSAGALKSRLPSSRANAVVLLTLSEIGCHSEHYFCVFFSLWLAGGVIGNDVLLRAATCQTMGRIYGMFLFISLTVWHLPTVWSAKKLVKAWSNVNSFHNDDTMKKKFSGHFDDHFQKLSPQHIRRAHNKIPKSSRGEGLKIMMMQPSDMKWRGHMMPSWKPAVVLQTQTLSGALERQSLEMHPA